MCGFIVFYCVFTVMETKKKEMVLLSKEAQIHVLSERSKNIR